MSEHILCTWCKDVLNSTDKIYSTSCGHIFHYNCMRSFQSRSTACPECSCINPPTHEMFLSFEKCRDENVSNSWNEKMKIIELHREIEEHKTNFLHLQEKYSVSQDLLRKLEEKNRISNNGFLQRAAIISDLEDRINELEELNQFLTIDNECKQDALTLNSKQITELKGLWLKKEKGAFGSKSNKEIKTFEGKFQSHSNELEKEMPPTQLSVVKTNLEEYVKLPGFEGTMTPNIRDNVNTNVALTNSTTGSSLWIKNFPKKDLMYPLTKVILTFVATIEGLISQDDISDVHIKDGKGKSYFQLPDKVTLFVQFKNQNLKHRFLLNRAQIRQTSPSLELIEINKYNDEIEETTKRYSDGKTIEPNSGDGSLKPHQNRSHKLCLPHDTKDDISTTSISECSMNSDGLIDTHHSNLSNDSCLFIKNFPKKDLIYPLKKVIFTFVATIEGCVSENDIIKVYVKDGHGKSYFQLPDKVTLFVQFKNQDLKLRFLLNRAQILQTSPSLELIEINKYNDEIEETTKRYSEGKTIEPNSKDNINTKVECTDGSLIAHQNGSDKLCLPHDTKEDISVNSISECSVNSDSLSGTHPKENINLSAGNTLLIKNIPKNQLEYPLKNVILQFVVTNEGYVSENDITKVYVKNGYKKSFAQLPMKVTLFVQFKNQNLKTKFLLNRDKIKQTSPSLQFVEVDEHNNNVDIKGTDKSVIRTHSNDTINSCTGNCLLIKNFPKKDLIYPLKNIILTFVATKEGCVSDNDIIKVYVKGGFGKNFSQLPMKVTLFVEFKNQDLKMKFLLNRVQILQTSPSLELIEMVDKNNDSIKGTVKRNTDGKTIKPNSRENINKKPPLTDGLLNCYQNVPDNISLSHDIDYYAILPCPSVIREQPKDNSNSLKKELIKIKKYNNDDIKETDKNCNNEKTMKPNSIETITTKPGPDKLSLSLDKKEDYSVISISEILMDSDSENRTHPGDNIHSSTGNSLLKNDKQGYPLKNELIQINKYNDYIKVADKSNSLGKTMKPNSRENICSKMPLTEGSLKLKYPMGPDKLCVSQGTSVSTCSMDNSRKHPNDGINSPTGNSIFLRNVPSNELIYPLKKFILKLVASKEGCISEKDITSVQLKYRGKKNSQLPMKVTLFVQFKNQDFKEAFLLNRAEIQEKLPSVELIEIDKRKNDTSKDLLQYAIQKLSSKGFSYFFIQNDEVMALKNRLDTEGIRILNKSHVNDLLKS